MSILDSNRDEIIEMMRMSPEGAFDAINMALSKIINGLMNDQPLKFYQFFERGLIDALTLTDADGNEYGALFPYHNLYLAEGKNSKHPKDYRLRFNEKTEMYECWTVNPDVNTEGETVWIPEMVSCLNIGQLLSCNFVGMGLDPCGEPKIAIYLEQVSCDFDRLNIEMTTRKENTDENND